MEFNMEKEYKQKLDTIVKFYKKEMKDVLKQYNKGRMEAVSRSFGLPNIFELPAR